MSFEKSYILLQELDTDCLQALEKQCLALYRNQNEIKVLCCLISEQGERCTRWNNIFKEESENWS